MSIYGFDTVGQRWVADDGRVFSLPTMSVVNEDDADYGQWLRDGGIVNQWPRDNDGAQTVEEIYRTLAPYGLGPLASAPAAQTITYKLDFWRRMSNDEAEAVEMALAGAPVRDRRMIEEAQVLNHADADFARLREAVVGMFGQSRADELLAPSPAA